MSHSESAIAGFYDHEQEPTRSRRERDAPDWGGDDLFTSTPRRRRFDRPARGESLTTRRRETTEHPLPRRVSGAQTARRGEGQALDLGIVSDVLAVAPVPVAPEPEVEAHVATTTAPAPAGRRTVLVTGHPDPVPVRRRPPPTMDERLIGSRPERIASYAFAMGLLLILIAFLTAQA